MISASQLTKIYPVAVKEPGLAGTFRHFFRRTWKEIPAVKGVQFEVARGEVVGFLGPNGAGKTTTLKMLTGLIHPTSGTAKVAGFTPWLRQREYLRRITLVMGQKQQLIWDLPALDSLRVNAAIYNIDPRERDRRIGELAEMLDLTQKLTQPVRKLSLGERMKAELMAALLHRPEVLFLDEPTLGLDVNAQAAVRSFLKDYRERYDATILLTSHYMADIEALCPRVILIHEGSLMYDGGLPELVTRLAPWREVRIELGAAPTREQLSTYGEVASLEGRSARVLVPREGLTRVVSRLLSELSVADLTVADPPIEEVIGKVFLQGRVA